jgi:hypothetical protein
MEYLKDYLLDEIDNLICSNWNSEIDLSDDEKNEIVDDLTEYNYDLTEYIKLALLDKMENKFHNKYIYLYAKEKACGLDKEERYDFNTLSMIYNDIERE